MKATAKHLVGRTIVAVDMRPYHSEDGLKCSDPRIELDNGRALFFVSEDGGGTSICITDKPKRAEKFKAGDIVVWHNCDFRVRAVLWPEARIESIANPGAFSTVSLSQLQRKQ